MSEEEKRKVAEEMATIVRKLITTTAQVGNLSLKNPDIIESLCAGLQMEIDRLRSNS